MLGSESKVFPPLEKLKQWDLVDDPKQWTWLRVILAAGTLIMLAGVPLSFLGDGVRQIIVVFETVAPSVAFAVLFRNYLRGHASSLDKLLIAAFLIFRFVGGMASGWLGSTASMVIVVGAVY